MPPDQGSPTLSLLCHPPVCALQGHPIMQAHPSFLLTRRVRALRGAEGWCEGRRWGGGRRGLEETIKRLSERIVAIPVRSASRYSDNPQIPRVHAARSGYQPCIPEPALGYAATQTASPANAESGGGQFQEAHLYIKSD